MKSTDNTFFYIYWTESVLLFYFSFCSIQCICFSYDYCYCCSLFMSISYFTSFQWKQNTSVLIFVYCESKWPSYSCCLSFIYFFLLLMWTYLCLIQCCRYRSPLKISKIKKIKWAFEIRLFYIGKVHWLVKLILMEKIF